MLPVSHSDSLQYFLHEVMPSHPVYANNLLSGRTRALENQFVATQNFLGNTIFNSLAQVYVEHYPSTDWDINLYGDQFPVFVSAQSRSGKKHVINWAQAAWLADLEYQLICLYYHSGTFGTVRMEQLFPQNLEKQNIKESLHQLTQVHPWLKWDEPSPGQKIKPGSLLFERSFTDNDFHIGLYTGDFNPDVINT